MERNGELDDAETRAEMPARDRDRADRFRAQLVGNLPQLALAQLPEIRGITNRVEQLGFHCHASGLVLTTPRVMLEYPNSGPGSERSLPSALPKLRACLEMVNASSKTSCTREF